jgi:HlyD family secretion protein
MGRPERIGLIAVGLILVAGVPIYLARGSGTETPIIGVVRATEVRVEPEVAGQLVSIAVEKGAHVHAGDILARLSAVELTAQVTQARAALAEATASRNNTYAGARREQIDSLKNEIAKGKAGLEYLQAQLTRAAALARENDEPQQALDQAENDAAAASADVAEAQANYDAAAAAAVAVLERHLEKTIVRAPADGIVSVIAAEIGENVRAGQPILMIEETGKQWMSFNAREDYLRGLAVGETVDVASSGGASATKGLVTELRPLGAFATWQAERVIGDHDRSTLRIRLDPQGDPAGLEPGMTVWIER